MKQLSFLFAGDVMTHNNQLRAAFNAETGKYDFTGNFKSITHYIRDVDIAVCNLETTIAGGEPTGYPRFNTPAELVDAIRDAGFQCVATANNHSYDSGVEGIIKTRQALEDRALLVAGSRKKPREKAYAMLTAQGVKVAVLNYTYETARFKGRVTLNNRQIGVEAEALLNTFGYCTIEADLKKISKEIANARADGAQIVLMYYHWGNEYERYSNVFQKYVAWRTAHMGVDAIIGSHAHVMQEISEITVRQGRKEKTVPVFYGLGNYIWGQVPIRGRDTVLNNILAKLDVAFDETNGRVCVTPSYIPMFIAIDKDKFYTVDLNNVPAEDYASFKEKFGYSVEQLQQQIAETAQNRIHGAPIRYHFDKIFTMQQGQRLSLLEGFLPKNQYTSFFSEDAIIASVLQNGYVIGNTAGYVGITATDANGVETVCMVRVLPGTKGKFPVLVNQHNAVRDIYVPAGRVSGANYGLPDTMSLCLSAANAWKAMLLAARNEGIYLKPVSCFRSKKGQLTRINDYAKIYGDAAAARRYQQFGRTEHHLGVALDVNGGTYNSVTTPKADAFEWVRKNCKKFGFIARKSRASVAQTAYVHLRYLDDRELAKYLTENALSLEEYLTEYDQRNAEFEKYTAWQRRELTKADESYTLTLHKICHDILQIPVPEEFQNIRHRVVPQILLHDSVPIQKGSIFFYDKNLLLEMRRCRNALRSGSVLAFASQQIVDEAGVPMPTIIVDDPLEACVKVGKFIRDQKPAKTVCITGSAGKSTTTDLIYHVLASKFNTHMTKLNNANSRVWILQILQALQMEHEMFVQEVGGSFPQHIEKGAQMLQPDVAIVTNIAEAHLDLYKTFDNIKHDKLSLIENRRPGGLGLLNMDNQWCKERYDQSRDGILTYSIEDPSADYYAADIAQSMEGLQMVIVEKSTGLRTPITQCLIGRHNAYNILCAFAVGRWAGMSAKEIVAGMQAYKTKGMRQNLCHVGGYHLLIDCFNAVELAFVSAVSALHEINCQPGTKKIAVLWGLRNKTDDVYARVAQTIRQMDIDHVLLYGPDSVVMAEELKKGKIQDVRHTMHFAEMVEWIRTLSRPGDIILFKGPHGASTALAADCAFGTGFLTANLKERTGCSKAFTQDDYTGAIIHEAAAVIDKASTDKAAVVIPDTVDNIPVVCVNKKAFAGLAMEQVTLGEQVVSLQEGAFKDCAKLSQVSFGKQLRYIGEQAFMNCAALRQMELPRTCAHIESMAFAGCVNLETVIIPRNVLYIAPDAFLGCPKVVIEAAPGSYAQQYATKNGISFRSAT